MPGSSPEDTSVVETPVTATETPTTPTTTDSTTAASSTTETKPAETLLDRIKSAIAKPGDSPTSASGSPAVADPAKTAELDDSGKLSDEEAKTLGPRTKVRIEGLSAKVRAQGTELEKLRPQAAEFDKIDTFIRNAGLSPQDVGSTLQIAALLRSDPQAARERLQPIMAELDRMLGEKLPAELQARVDQGYLTAEDALALNRASAAASLATKRATALTERQQQEATDRTQKAEVNATLDAVTAWEKQKAKGDPDWHQKQAEVSELVELAINRKSLELKRSWFPNPEEATKLSEDALKTVEGRFKRFAPKARQIDPPVTAGASPRSTPAPKNTMDIIRRVVGGGANG